MAQLAPARLITRAIWRGAAVQGGRARKISKENIVNKKSEKKEKVSGSEKELTLADLPVGASATIVKIIPNSRGEKKFADVGLVPGAELVMQAHAPFGGLIRVKVMETSMALHASDAKNIVMKKGAKKGEKAL